MEVHCLISGLLFLAAILVWLRPQSVSTLSRYSKEQLARVDLRRVRRTGTFGLVVLALLIGPCNWLLHRAGVDAAALTVVSWIVLFAGAIAIAARIETFNRNK